VGFGASMTRANPAVSRQDATGYAGCESRAVSTRCGVAVKTTHTSLRTAAALPRGLVTACGGEHAAKLRTRAESVRQRQQRGFRGAATQGVVRRPKGGQRAQEHANAVARPRPRPSGNAQRRTDRGAATEPPSTSNASAMRPVTSARRPAALPQQRAALGASRATARTCSERGKMCCTSASVSFCLCRTPQLNLLPAPERCRYRREACIITRGGDVRRDARFCRDACPSHD
jgi:hypothetical protein